MGNKWMMRGLAFCRLLALIRFIFWALPSWPLRECNSDCCEAASVPDAIISRAWRVQFSLLSPANCVFFFAQHVGAIILQEGVCERDGKQQEQELAAHFHACRTCTRWLHVTVAGCTWMLQDKTCVFVWFAPQLPPSVIYISRRSDNLKQRYGTSDGEQIMRPATVCLTAYLSFFFLSLISSPPSAGPLLNLVSGVNWASCRIRGRETEM